MKESVTFFNIDYLFLRRLSKALRTMFPDNRSLIKAKVGMIITILNIKVKYII